MPDGSYKVFIDSEHKKGELCLIEAVIPGKSKKEVGVEVHSISPLILTKLFEASGSKVIQMDRVVFGGLTKKDLPRGKWRRLTTKEIGFLKMMS